MKLFKKGAVFVFSIVLLFTSIGTTCPFGSVQ